MPFDILEERPIQEPEKVDQAAPGTQLRLIGERTLTDPDDIKPEWSDYGRQIMAGYASMGAGLGWVGQKLGEKTGVDFLERAGIFLKESGRNARDTWLNERLDTFGIREEGLSANARHAMEIEFLGDSSFKEKWQKAKLLAVGSLPATAGGLGAGGMFAKGLSKLGLNPGWAAALGYGGGEAGVAAPMAGEAVDAEVMALQHDELMEQSPEYRLIYDSLENTNEGHRRERARRVLAGVAAGDAAAMTLVSTFALSAPAGAVLQKFLPDGITQQSGRIVSGIKGGTTEAIQEFFQSGSEQLWQNIALRDIGLDIGLMDDVLEEAVGGALSGAPLGAAMGLAAPGGGTAPATVPEDRRTAPDVEAETVLGDVAESRNIPETDVDESGRVHLVEEGEAERVDRYQFMKGESGIAHQVEVLPLNQERFLRYIRPYMDENSPNYVGTVEEYQEKYPDNTHISLIRNGAEQEWRPNRTGTRETLTKFKGETGRHVRPVDDFDSPEAAEWAQLKASELGKKSAGAINPQQDSLLAAIAKLGGLNRQVAESEGIDPAEFDTRGAGIKRVFTKSGRTPEDLAEVLSEHGYPVVDESGVFSGPTLMDRVFAELQGEAAEAPEGAEARIEAEYEQRRTEEAQRAREEASEPDYAAINAELTDLAYEGQYPGEMDEEARSLADLAMLAREYAGEDAVEDALMANTDAQAAQELWALVNQEKVDEQTEAGPESPPASEAIPEGQPESAAQTGEEAAPEGAEALNRLKIGETPQQIRDAMGRARETKEALSAAQKELDESADEIYDDPNSELNRRVDRLREEHRKAEEDVDFLMITRRWPTVETIQKHIDSGDATTEGVARLEGAAARLEAGEIGFVPESTAEKEIARGDERIEPPETAGEDTAQRSESRAQGETGEVQTEAAETQAAAEDTEGGGLPAQGVDEPAGIDQAPEISDEEFNDPAIIWKGELTESGRQDLLRHAGVSTPNEADVQRIAKIDWHNLSERNRQDIAAALPTFEVGGVRLYASEATEAPWSLGDQSRLEQTLAIIPDSHQGAQADLIEALDAVKDGNFEKVRKHLQDASDDLFRGLPALSEVVDELIDQAGRPPAEAPQPERGASEVNEWSGERWPGFENAIGPTKTIGVDGKPPHDPSKTQPPEENTDRYVVEVEPGKQVVADVKDLGGEGMMAGGVGLYGKYASNTGYRSVIPGIQYDPDEVPVREQLESIASTVYEKNSKESYARFSEPLIAVGDKFVPALVGLPNWAGPDVIETLKRYGWTLEPRGQLYGHSYVSPHIDIENAKQFKTALAPVTRKNTLYVDESELAAKLEDRLGKLHKKLGLPLPGQPSLLEQPTQEEIDEAANKAATSPENDLPQPTQAQKEANGEGNYKLGDPVELHGVTWRVENPAGSYRFKFDEKAWTEIADKVVPEKADFATTKAKEKTKGMMMSVISDLREGNVPQAFATAKKALKRVRSGEAKEIVDASWYNKMPAHYARALEVEGADGDKLDAFLGLNAANQKLPIHVADIEKLDGKGYDESKVLIGFNSRGSAWNTLKASYDEGMMAKLVPGGIESLVTFTPREFDRWIKSGKTNEAAKWFDKTPNFEEATPTERREKYGDLTVLGWEKLDPNVLMEQTTMPIDSSKKQRERDDPAAYIRVMFDRELRGRNVYTTSYRGYGEDNYTVSGSVRQIKTDRNGLEWEQLDTDGRPLERWHDFAHAVTFMPIPGREIRPSDMKRAVGNRNKHTKWWKDYGRFAEQKRGTIGAGATEVEGELGTTDTIGAQPLGESGAEPASQTAKSRKPGQSSGERGTKDKGRNAKPDRSGSDTGRGVATSQGALFDSAGRAAVDFARVRDGKDSGNLPDTQRDGRSKESRRSSRSGSELSLSNYVISESDEVGKGGAKIKARNNIEAIRVVKAVTTEGRVATAEEQRALVKYVGWGGIPQIFDANNDKWSREYDELKDILTKEEWEAARRSTQDAHYTALPVIREMYRGLERLGFKGGKLLEPAVGIGHFFGVMPESMRSRTQGTGVELDVMTAQIAGALYPKYRVHQTGFEKFNVPDNYYDIVIGNPPFGNQKVFDPERKKISRDFSIHNYFIAKAIDVTRPGGVTAVVVSRYFMDTLDTKARAYISKRADLLGAVRLPRTAFMDNANTEVVTDIVFFQKREGEPTSIVMGKWPRVEKIKINKLSKLYKEEDPQREGGAAEIRVNSYFVDNPSAVLGEHALTGSMYSNEEYTVEPITDQPVGSLDKQLRSALERILPEGVITPRNAEHQADVEADAAIDPEDAAAVPVHSFFEKGDKVYQRAPDIAGEAQWVDTGLRGTRLNRAKGLIKIRDLVRKQLRLELNDAEPNEINSNRRKLNTTYDNYQRRFGYVHALGNKQAFEGDPAYSLLLALEKNYDKGVSKAVAKKRGIQFRAPKADKADIFNSRVLQPFHSVTKTTNAKDALFASLAERGAIEQEFMEGLYDKPFDQQMAELGDLVYEQHDGSGWVTADEYLSGNVKDRLLHATKAAENDQRFTRNVKALSKVIPADLEPVDIKISSSSPWIPAKYLEDFSAHLFGEGTESTINYIRAKGTFSTKVRAGNSVQDRQTWGTARAPGTWIFERMLSGKLPKVYDRSYNPPSSTLNQEATTAATEKLEEMRREFESWVWEDKARRDDLAQIYNDRFNTDVEREYDGSFLAVDQDGKPQPLPGANPEIQLRPTQKNFVWRYVQDGVVLADHVVGAGKTFGAISAVMERKRLGLINKPMYTVPNHLVDQWAADVVRLYPGANVLAATEKDFAKANRRVFMSKIATGNWDAVIVAHSSFELIQMPTETLENFVRQETAALEESIIAAADDRRTVKQLEKRKDSLKAKLEAQIAAKEKDDVVFFDELGVDALIADEFHMFKNLAYNTTLGRSVSGLGTTTGSQRATDMFVKIRYILENNGDQNFMALTGTPISNSIAELYTMQRYMGLNELRARGVDAFDAWANTFANVVADWEIKASGLGYELKPRFREFKNIPELMMMYSRFADVVLQDDLIAMRKAEGKPPLTPPIKGGGPTNVVVERSPDQAAYMNDIIKRVDNLKNVDPSEDNMLKVTNDARSMALDMRLRDPEAADFEGSKTNMAANKVKELYDQYQKVKGTQLVFIDLSTPKNVQTAEQRKIAQLMEKAESGDEKALTQLEAFSQDQIMAVRVEFDAYNDLKGKLVERGIPEKEVAFIHQASTRKRKEELFEQVRQGAIRVLFGSTEKMGAGMNVQTRLVAEHHIDAPWRPSDLEQREGRIIRQGNALYDPEAAKEARMKSIPDFEIEIYRYATEQTYDARMWQTIEFKAKFIEQIRRAHRTGDRVVEDIGGEAANAAAMKAAASGNPLIEEEVKLRADIRKLETLEREHTRSQHATQKTIDRTASYEKDLAADLALIDQDIAQRTKKVGKKGEFAGIQVRGSNFSERVKGGKAIQLEMLKFIKSGKASEEDVGKYRGFSFSFAKENRATFIELDGNYRNYYTSFAKDSKLDPVGITQRLEHLVESFEEYREGRIGQSQEEARELEAARARLGAKFEKADELKEKIARHKEVLAKLSEAEKKQKDAGNEKVDLHTGTYKGRGLGVRMIKPFVDKLTANWKNLPAQVVVTTRRGMVGVPDNVRRQIEAMDLHSLARGANDRQGKRVFLFADNLPSLAETERVIIHEIKGHFGTQVFLGDGYRQFTEQAFKAFPEIAKQEAKHIRADLRKKADRMRVADEVVARIAERIEARSATAAMIRLWDRYYSLFIRGLRKLGLIHHRPTRAELRNIVHQASMFVEKGIGKGPPPLSRLAADVDMDVRNFRSRRTKDLEKEMMIAVDRAKKAGDRLAEVNERLRFARMAKGREKVELALRRDIKRLTESVKTNPTAREPLRQAKLMLQQLRKGDISAMEAESAAAREAYETANEAMQRAIELRNEAARVDMMVAYHGTGARFDKFDISKIGTGEGAQAYGWGLYFAENKEVASYYMRPDKVITKPGEKWSPGVVYEVDIPDESIDTMIDWDEPLDKQPDVVRKAVDGNPWVKKTIRSWTGSFGAHRITGEQIYDAFAQAPSKGKTSDSKAASMALLEAGVLGNKFWDQASRTGVGAGGGFIKPLADAVTGKTKRTRNIVLFDDSLVTIKSIDGSPVKDTKAEHEGLAEFASIVAKHEPGDSPAMQEVVDYLTDPDNGVQLSRMRSEENQRRERGFLNALKKGQPIDRAFRVPFKMFGSIDAHGEFHVSPKAKVFVANVVEQARAFMASDRFTWLHHIGGVAHAEIIKKYGIDDKWTQAVETAKRGVIDRYGLPEDYIARDFRRSADDRALLMEAQNVLRNLMDEGVGVHEAEVLYRMLTGQEVNDTHMARLAEPIQQAIDQMGQEAVDLGLISAESYQRNRGAYLHRSYKIHEAGKTPLGKMVSNVLAQRRRGIIGDQFKGRGMFLKKEMDTVLKHVPESWWGRKKRKGKADIALKGEKFIVLDRISDPAFGQPDFPGMDPSQAERKILERIYWPADIALPAKFAGLENRGEFEVRDVVKGKLVLWRDFSEEERSRMGEIVDARYAIAKTYLQMAHDLSTGRFFKDIATNQDWASKTDPTGDSPDGKESRLHLQVDSPWVRVPDTKIPKSNTAKYGALAGMYVRSEIWKDMVEIRRMQNKSFWRKVMTQWKLNKTARNPVVHMNNIMANIMLMDMVDVRVQDLIEGMRSFINEDAYYQDALQHGAFGVDIISQEIRKDILTPILQQIEAENVAENGTGIWGVMMRLGTMLRNADSRMQDLYRMEDEVFRMATYMRQIGQGFTPEEAAMHARNQFLNYDIRAPWINTLRETVLPFISYTYRAVPVVASSMASRPWKMAKYFTVAYMLNALSYLLNPGDEEEERATMREGERGKTWIGVPRMVRLPFQDSWGNPMFIDIRRWIPAGDVFDMHQGSSALPIPAPLQFGGPLMIMSELMLNRAAFTGKDIVDDLIDSPGEKAAKWADFLWKSASPSAPWIPGSWYYGKIKGAAFGELDPMMREYSVPLAISSSLGIKLKPHDVALNRRYLMMHYDRIDRALTEQLQALQRDLMRNRIGQEYFDERVAEIREKQRKVGEERRKLLPR